MKTIKNELKSLASQIRSTKNEIKDTMRAGNYAGRLQWTLPSLRCTFRYKHIAYCLLRGRSLEEIEPNSTACLETIQKHVDEYKAQLAAEVSHETVCAG